MEIKTIECRRNICNVPEDKCSLAMAFVPVQPWEQMYDDETAFKSGTAFPSLDLKFDGRMIIK